MRTNNLQPTLVVTLPSAASAAVSLFPQTPHATGNWYIAKENLNQGALPPSEPVLPGPLIQQWRGRRLAPLIDQGWFLATGQRWLNCAHLSLDESGLLTSVQPAASRQGTTTEA